MFELREGKKASQESGVSFEEIVGQPDLKRALLAVAANEALSGLLVRGEKGTAKSTAVRALSALLPNQTVVADCPYGCPPDDPDRQCADCRERTDPETAERAVPVVTLPLGTTREHVVGTLSVAEALGGEFEFDPGLLARANRGILYVDEVNLLDDHLVDVLLDAAANGVNRVERDGVSVVHPAEFTLVGTMNPEEGDLRPQLRDRFALCVDVAACTDLDKRVAIIERALGDETSEANDDRTEEYGCRLRRARESLPAVTLTEEFTTEIAELCRDAGVEGHRADIATARAARTLAALDGRPTVIESDVGRAAELALTHRLRSRPFEDPPNPEDLLEDRFGDETDESEPEPDETGSSDDERDNETTEEEKIDGPDADGLTDKTDPSGTDNGDRPENDEADGDGSSAEPDDGETKTPPPTRPTTDDGTDSVNDETDSGSPSTEPESGGAADDEDDATKRTPLVPGESRAEIGEARALDVSAPVAIETAKSGSRSRARPGTGTDGPRVRTSRADSTGGIDAAASVRAAADRGGGAIESRDLRQSVRAGDSSALVVFVVDASASMRSAMAAAKGVVLELLKDSYQQRDEVGFVAFAGEGADVLLPPTNSVSLAARHLKDLPTADRTPLPAGLHTATEVIARADPAASVAVVVTDGRANVADGSPVEETRSAACELAATGAHTVVVDAGEDDRGLVNLLVTETGGERVGLSSLSAGRIDESVATARGTTE